MAGFNINDLLNAKSKGAAVQTEGPAEQEQEGLSNWFILCYKVL